MVTLCQSTVTFFIICTCNIELYCPVSRLFRQAASKYLVAKYLEYLVATNLCFLFKYLKNLQLELIYSLRFQCYQFWYFGFFPFKAATFLTLKTISLLTASHDHSSLSPSFNFHCLTIDIGTVVRSEANRLEFFASVVCSPSVQITFHVFYILNLLLYYTKYNTMHYTIILNTNKLILQK